MGATYLLPNVVGTPHARDLLITGRSVLAEEGLQEGVAAAREKRSPQFRGR